MAEISTLNGYKIKDKKAVRFYDTVADMVADTTLKNGMYVKTKGASTVNDGGASEYHITDDESSTNTQEILSNGLYAEIVLSGSVDPKQFGAKADGITDDSDAINKAFENVRLRKGVVTLETNKTYKINTPIYIPQGCSLYGNGATIISSCDVNKYAIYVNSDTEDTNLETVGQSISILSNFRLESSNENFTDNYNGIHFACHGVVEYIIFNKIDKCVRFSHPLYIDKFRIDFCYASGRSTDTNYAFDLGENGDAHEINNVQQGSTGSSAEFQPKFIHVGSYILNSKMSNIVGNGLIDIRGECDVSNIMLSYYGKINVQTSHKNITLKNVYVSTDNIRADRITSINNHILNLKNCRFISNYVQTHEFDTEGFPITFTNTDHVYIDQCEIGSRTSTSSSNYSLINMEETFGHDLVNPTIKNGDVDFSIAHSTFNALADVYGNMNGTFNYTSYIVYDVNRLIAKTGTKSKEVTASSKGVRLANFTKNLPMYLTREDSNDLTVGVWFYLDNNIVYDTGEFVNNIPWSSNLIDVSDFNTSFSKVTFSGENVSAFLDDNFSTPNGTWVKNDIIYANDGIYKFNGTQWNNIS